MGNKKEIEASVAQLTDNGSFVYPWLTKETTIVTFSATYNTCYYGNKVLTKIKGGRNGGNYQGKEDSEIYRVWQHKN